MMSDEACPSLCHPRQTMSVMLALLHLINQDACPVPTTGSQAFDTIQQLLFSVLTGLLSQWERYPNRNCPG